MSNEEKKRKANQRCGSYSGLLRPDATSEPQATQWLGPRSSFRRCTSSTISSRTWRWRSWKSVALVLIVTWWQDDTQKARKNHKQANPPQTVAAKIVASKNKQRRGATDRQSLFDAWMQRMLLPWPQEQVKTVEVKVVSILFRRFFNPDRIFFSWFNPSASGAFLPQQFKHAAGTEYSSSKEGRKKRDYERWLDAPSESAQHHHFFALSHPTSLELSQSCVLTSVLVVSAEKVQVLEKNERTLAILQYLHIPGKFLHNEAKCLETCRERP